MTASPLSTGGVVNIDNCLLLLQQKRREILVQVFSFHSPRSRDGQLWKSKGCGFLNRLTMQQRATNPHVLLLPSLLQIAIYKFGLRKSKFPLKVMNFEYFQSFWCILTFQEQKQDLPVCAVLRVFLQLHPALSVSSERVCSSYELQSAGFPKQTILK